MKLNYCGTVRVHLENSELSLMGIAEFFHLLVFYFKEKENESFVQLQSGQLGQYEGKNASLLLPHVSDQSMLSCLPSRTLDICLHSHNPLQKKGVP